MLKGDITVELVERLVASKFPQWAGLPVGKVAWTGGTTRRFASERRCRSGCRALTPYAAQVDKEQRRLPVLAPRLPVPIPTPLARGEPGPLFPRPWSVYGWIEGDLRDAELVPDLTAFARDLAGFLAALYACKPDGPTPGDHSFARGGPVSIWDDQTRATLADVDGTVDTRGALAVWEAALTARHEARRCGRTAT